MKLKDEKLRIVHINGSPHAAIGNSYILVKRFLAALEKNGTQVELVNHFLARENVVECRGCTRCMRKGDCVMSDKDDVERMVQDLLLADFVIYSTPVHVLNITSLLKKFFDRTAFMTHRMSLKNKNGIFILSSQGLGVDNVSRYIQHVMEAMGINVLGAIKGTAIFHNQFLNENEIDESITKIIDILESNDYNELSISKSNENRNEKLAFLMENQEVSKKLFREDAKYWSARTLK